MRFRVPMTVGSWRAGAVVNIVIGTTVEGVEFAVAFAVDVEGRCGAHKHSKRPESNPRSSGMREHGNDG